MLVTAVFGHRFVITTGFDMQAQELEEKPREVWPGVLVMSRSA